MDEDTKSLLEAVKNLSKYHNELAEAYIKFSVQYARVSQRIKDLEDQHPKLFTH